MRDYNDDDNKMQKKGNDFFLHQTCHYNIIVLLYLSLAKIGYENDRY